MKGLRTQSRQGTAGPEPEQGQAVWKEGPRGRMEEVESAGLGWSLAPCEGAQKGGT